jgi:colicin import membrane protein
LKKVKFTYDSSTTRDQQAAEGLEDLVSELEAQILASRQARDVRELEQKKARQKAEQATAEVRRKEKERRKNRERLQAELKRQEAEERSKEEAKSRGSQEEADVKRRREMETSPIASFGDDKKGHESKSRTTRKSNQVKQRVSKKPKGADFYNPLKVDDLSEEDSPAEPKLLLPTFESWEDSLPSTQMTATTQNSDKRVRWEDEEGDDDDSVEEPPTTLAQDVLKEDTSKVASCKKRQYGSSNKGLASLSRSKNVPSNKTSSRSLSTRTSRYRPVACSSEQGEDDDDFQNDDGSMVSLESKSKTRHSKGQRSGDLSNKLTAKSEIKNIKSKEPSDHSSSFNDGLSINSPAKISLKRFTSTGTSKRSEKSFSRRSKHPKREREEIHFDSLVNVTSYDDDHSSRIIRKPRLNEENARDRRLPRDNNGDQPRKSREAKHHDLENAQGKEAEKLKKKKSLSHDAIVDERGRRTSGDEEADESRRIRNKSSSQGRANKANGKPVFRGQEADTWKNSDDAKRQYKSRRASSTSSIRNKDAKTTQSSREFNGSRKFKSSVAKSLQPLDLSTKQPPSTARLNESTTGAKSSSSTGSRKSYVGSKKSGGSRKRKSSEESSSQTSGLSSSERGPKARRRKKKEPLGSKQKLSKSIGEDAYDFHF